MWIKICRRAIRAKVKLSQLLPGQWLPWETQGEENEGGAPGEDGVYLCTCVLVYLCTCVLGRGVWQLGGEGVGKEWSFEGDGTIMIDLVPAASLFALYIFARPMICPRICGTCICFKCHPNNHWCKLVWEVWDISGPIGNLNCWPNKLEFNEKKVYKVTTLRTFFPLWKTLTEEVSTKGS